MAPSMLICWGPFGKVVFDTFGFSTLEGAPETITNNKTRKYFSLILTRLGGMQTHIHKQTQTDSHAHTRRHIFFIFIIVNITIIIFIIITIIIILSCVGSKSRKSGEALASKRLKPPMVYFPTRPLHPATYTHTFGKLSCGKQVSKSVFWET